MVGRLHRMQRATILVSLLVLGWTWTIQAGPVLPEPLYPTQENFNLARFMGTWHDVAVATTCSYIRLPGRDAAIGKLTLQKDTEGHVKMTRTTLRHGTCKEVSGEYALTSTPGRFVYHIAKWKADIDAYVVHTNYDEYAIVLLSKRKSSGEKSTSVKLYSRTMEVRHSLLEDFKTLVKQQGMSDDTIIIKKNKGDCVPGEQVAEPVVSPGPQRVRRHVVPTLAPADLEGSGDDTPLFNGSQACKSAPDSGPCFGMHQRYYYNSSSMSCEIFKYGGCLGNQNNFHSERECLQRCRTEAVCRLPLAPLSCTGQPSIWAFDSGIGLCVPYKKDYCQANANKFYSKGECEEYCGVVRDDPEFLKTN